MSAEIGQETVNNLTIAQATSGNIVISQESVNDDATSVVVELKALPFLIATLKTYLPKRKTS